MNNKHKIKKINKKLTCIEKTLLEDKKKLNHLIDLFLESYDFFIKWTENAEKCTESYVDENEKEKKILEKKLDIIANYVFKENE